MDANGQDPGHVSRRERTRQQHREEILSAATDLFARHGYEGTSMQMIADQAEISVGKLYLHFEGKEDIYMNVADYHAAKIRERASDATNPSMSPMDRIRARTGAVIDYLEENESMVRFYVSEMEGLGKGCSHLKESEHYLHLNELRDLFVEAIDAGEILGEDPDLLVAMMHGAGHAMMSVFVSRGEMEFRKVFDCIDRLILRPLEERKHEEDRKEGAV